MTADNRITMGELHKIFGEGMPWSAVAILQDPDGTPDTARVKLKALAAEIKAEAAPHKLTAREPTDAMIKAGQDADGHRLDYKQARDVWIAMHDLAPPPDITPQHPGSGLNLPWSLDLRKASLSNIGVGIIDCNGDTVAKVSPDGNGFYASAEAIVQAINATATPQHPPGSSSADEAIPVIDLAWEAVNAEGGSSSQDNIYDQGIIAGIDRALDVIEKLGGKDPAPQRAEMKRNGGQ